MRYPRPSSAFGSVQAGRIRFGVEVVGQVPAPWTPFARALDEIDDYAFCEVVYAPPSYLVKLG